MIAAVSAIFFATVLSQYSAEGAVATGANNPLAALFGIPKGQVNSALTLLPKITNAVGDNLGGLGKTSSNLGKFLGEETKRNLDNNSKLFSEVVQVVPEFASNGFDSTGSFVKSVGNYGSSAGKQTAEKTTAGVDGAINSSLGIAGGAKDAAEGLLNQAGNLPAALPKLPGSQ